MVYTQPETIEYYQKKRRFPNGAVLLKELLYAETISMTTGPAVGHATTIKGFFVLVRDTKGRFKGSPLWGDGWGWSFFNADDRVNTISAEYKGACVHCHVPAKDLHHGMPKQMINGFTHSGTPCFGKSHTNISRQSSGERPLLFDAIAPSTSKFFADVDFLKSTSVSCHGG